MKKLVCIVLAMGLLTVVFAQEIKKTPLQTMVDTELAFARMSLDDGTRPAFMAFIADDGILFRPRAVKGKQWMVDHPLPASDKRPLLSWYPAVAEMALAGDMGWTTGPWEFKSDIKEAQAVAWGNFLTVWKRQPDGSWKFAIDLGISNPKPDQTVAPFQPPKTHLPVPALVGVGKSHTDSNTLLARDREFSAASNGLGPQQAFAHFAAARVRLFRNGKQPIVGKADAVAAVATTTATWTWEPAFADVSKSGDLGFTYGTYKLTKSDPSLKEADKIETGNYFRVWRTENNITQGTKLKVVADLLDPVVEEKKN